MSSDQRPGKVRVFSSGANGIAPKRRQSDVDDAIPELVLASPSALPGASAGAGQFFLTAVLFVLGCALGGILLAWFGLLPGKTP